MNEETLDLRELRGLVATVVLTGSVTPEYAECREELRAFNMKHGFENVEYRTFQAQLVEQGRDNAVQHALNEDYAYLLQIDADATFAPDTLLQLLRTAYGAVPHADVVGAYSQLKHEPFLPTIDTGTGTWEPHYPGEGVLEVIRTGGHCLLTKTPILRKLGPPWFRTRKTLRPIDALTEVDNYARVKLDGRNPLRESGAWRTLSDAARSEAGGSSDAIGEDSAFCDAVKAVGGRIYVDTNIVTGHVARRVIQPDDLRDAMRDRERAVRLACGVVE